MGQPQKGAVARNRSAPERPLRRAKRSLSKERVADLVALVNGPLRVGKARLTRIRDENFQLPIPLKRGQISTVQRQVASVSSVSGKLI